MEYLINNIPIIILLGLTYYVLFIDKIRHKKFMLLISNIRYISIFITPTLIFCLFVLLSDSKYISERIISSTKKAIVAFFIALCAHLDLLVTPFWLIWVISYYLNIY